MHERRAVQRRDVLFAESEQPGSVGGQGGASTAVPAHVRRLEVDEVSDDGQRGVEVVAVQHAMGFGLEREHGVPRLGLAQAIEPFASVGDEQVGERGVVRAVAAIASGVEGVLRREETPDRLHVVAEMDDAHREGDRLTLRVGRIAVAVPALEGEAQRVADAGADVESLHEHVGDLAPRREVVDRPLTGGLLDHADDLFALLRTAAGRREGHHVPHDLGRIRGVVHECLGADGDLVAEHGGDLVGVPGAPDVAQQRHPVGGLALLFLDAGGVAYPRREQTRAQLRLERLPERVVLRERERRDEFTEAERCGQDGETSRCMGRRSPARSSHDASPLSIRAKCSLKWRTHGGITDPRR